MRHRVNGTALNMDTSHRRALNKFMATSFVENGSMVTTFTKAKVIRPFIEKLVTKAKVKSNSSVQALTKELNSKKAVDTLLDVVAPKFLSRPGGYIRLVKLMPRVGDNAPMARLEWVESMTREKKEVEKVTKQKEVEKKADKKVAKKVVKPSKKEK